MKYNRKNPLQKVTVATLYLVLVGLFAVTSCDKLQRLHVDELGKVLENIKYSCEFDDPLADLPWLKALTDELTLVVNEGNPCTFTIYQCTYGDGQIGFLRFGCPDYFPFYSCEGEILCALGGYMGSSCPHLNIDFANAKLIWEINN